MKTLAVEEFSFPMEQKALTNLGLQTLLIIPLFSLVREVDKVQDFGFSIKLQ